MVLLAVPMTLPEPPPQHAQASQAATAWPSCKGCNLLLISIDTLRADHLGAYGYRRPTSPQLDRLAGRSLLFERAYSTSYVTADSHMSVFTSLYPSVHGVRNASREERTTLRIMDSIATLPEVLAREGYDTAAVTGGGNISGVYGFDRGMGSYSSPTKEEDALRLAEDFVRRKRDKPFFLFMHTYHPHDPYTPSSEELARFADGYRGRIEHDRRRLMALRTDASFADARRVFWSLVDKHDRTDIAHLRALYDAEIREVDTRIGRLLDLVQQAAPNTLVVLMSDHGEQFGEHGDFLHGELYEELLRVPLMIAHPQGRPGRVPQRVSLVDLAPSVLDLLDIAAPQGFQGHTLRDVVTAGASRDILAEKAGKRAALIRGDRKTLVWFKADGAVRRWEGYDLSTDPREARKLPVPNSHKQALLQRLDENRRLRQVLVATGEDSPLPMAADTLKQLQALGYVQ